jgi:hypothetical protein
MEASKLINLDFLKEWIKLEKYDTNKSIIEFLRKWTYGKIQSVHCLRLNHTRRPTEEEVSSGKYHSRCIIQLDDLIKTLMSNEKYMPTFSQEYINDLNSSKTNKELDNKYFNYNCDKREEHNIKEDEHGDLDYGDSNVKSCRYQRKKPSDDLDERHYCMECIKELNLDINSMKSTTAVEYWENDETDYGYCSYCQNATSFTELYYQMENNTYDLCEECYDKLSETEKDDYIAFPYLDNPLEKYEYPDKIYYSPDCTMYYKIIYKYNDFTYTFHFMASCCNARCKIKENDSSVDDIVKVITDLLELNDTKEEYDLYEKLPSICFNK